MKKNNNLKYMIYKNWSEIMQIDNILDIFRKNKKINFFIFLLPQEPFFCYNLFFNKNYPNENYFNEINDCLIKNNQRVIFFFRSYL
jgi:hypothetical protein